jgi:16S rRNA (adenine1518-N6/adenine1519-N6)-dimethyltransferase
MKPHGKAHDIFLKKQYGQHFLREQRIVDHMIDEVNLKDASVFEIGPGDGFLTKTILTQPIARLWSFEIDVDWVNYLQEHIKDDRFTVFHENFLDIDTTTLELHQPWVVLANLPYQVTFPILNLLHRCRHMLKDGVLMMQEEVAQKLVKTRGKGFGYQSLFFQYYFDLKLMDKIAPGAFYPPPKVYSRLLYFRPKMNVKEIPQEEGFWRFIKVCFKQPRRTLRNNLGQTHYDLQSLSDTLLAKRAQELNMQELLEVWDRVRD